MPGVIKETQEWRYATTEIEMTGCSVQTAAKRVVRPAQAESIEAIVASARGAEAIMPPSSALQQRSPSDLGVKPEINLKSQF
jgi:hypothetical protein